MNISKTYIIIELTIIILLYVIIMWILIPITFMSSVSLYILLILFSSTVVYYFFISPFYIHKDTLKERGLGKRKFFYIRIDNFNKAWHSLYMPLAIISIIIIFVAWKKDTSFFIEPDWNSLFFRFLIYLVSAFFQDIFFFSFIFIRLKELVIMESNFHKRITVTLFFAIIFTIFHLPNIPVMILTFIFAFWLGYQFYKIPNLAVVVIVHAFLGTLLHFIYELHMKVGVFYGFEGNIIKTFILK